MKQILLFVFLYVAGVANSQVVYSDPALPLAADMVTVYFNAAEGNKALMDFDGDIYAHTGVITSESSSGSDWKYVIADWGENTNKAKLEKVENNLYKLVISPSVIDFYNVPLAEKIEQMAFVFRSADGSKVAKTAEEEDLYVGIHEAVLSASILSPAADLLIAANEEIIVKAVSSYSDSLILFVDSERIASTTTKEINYTLNAKTEGKHWIWIEAKDANASVYDSVYYFIKEPAPIAALPKGAKKGINYIDDKTVTLVLNAPEKEYTYLIGDFNNWDYSVKPAMVDGSYAQVSATTWVMNKTPDGEYHWITLGNLEANKEYAYQYLVDGAIRIADPYTEKVLDPWNDKYIDNATYPNLKPYPVGKTTEIVSVFETNQKKYEWQVADFDMPAVEDMVIYEMLIRDFVATHTYRTVADTLDYLKKLGVNVLELMPINEFEGNSSWGYNPSFYFAPEKYYGPKDDLKLLVDECHKRGIAVVIDLVLNHSFGQSPLVRMYWEGNKPAANNPWYNVDHNFTNSAAQWGFDFNHESVYTQELVDSINAFWMGEYNVDGFRFDFTKGFGNNIKDGSDEWGSLYDADRVRLLKRMSDEIWKRNPDAFISFEHLAENSEEKELAAHGINLWGNLNRNYNEGTMGYNEDGNSDVSWISYQERGWSKPNVVGYMESHDEERLMYKNLEYGNSNDAYNVKDLNTALHRNELAAAFFFTIPGPKMIWQFGELGYDVSIYFNERTGEKPIYWDYYTVSARKRLYDVYAALAELKVNEPTFKTVDYSLDLNGAVKRIHLYHDNMNVVVLGNFDITRQEVNPGFIEAGVWYDYFSGDSINVTDPNQSLVLAAGEYKLYSTKKLKNPGIGTSIKGDLLNDEIGDMSMYPNPASEELHFNYAYNNVEVFNVTGKRVLQRTNELLKTISIGELESGLYIVFAKDVSGKQYTGRFIKE